MSRKLALTQGLTIISKKYLSLGFGNTFYPSFTLYKRDKRRFSKMAKYDQTNSVIGEGSVFEGKFYIAGSLRIDGKFEGDIRTEDVLVVGQTGKVKTNIAAKEVIMSGTLIGDIEAKDEVRLTETGRMLGDVSTPVLSLSKGVVLKGVVNISGGHKKDAHKIVEESFGSSKELDRRGIG